MQKIFLDLQAGAQSRNPVLREWLQEGQAKADAKWLQGYDRFLLQAEDKMVLYDLLERVTFQESLYWTLLEEGNIYRQLLGPEDYIQFRQQAQQRMEKMEPQLRRMIREDLEQILPGSDFFNADGYLRFSAKKLKRLQRHLLQETYKRLEEELEQEAFIELLRFFISVQPPLLEEVHLTLYRRGFTLTDEWGNDLRQVYLESLLEEEIKDVSDNDLIMSILITLLPRIIYLEIQEPPESGAFLLLLQRVFGEQIIWKKAGSK